MDLNPFTYIEKYITEHGSAAVLEKHLALIKDQLAAAEIKLVEANARATLAESRATKAEELVAELQQRIGDLANKGDVLPEPQNKILHLLHRSDSLSVEQIASSIGLSAPDTKFHMDQLSEGEFVQFDLNKSVSVNRMIRSSPLVRARGGHFGDAPKSLGHYYIEAKGRAYVMKNG